MDDDDSVERDELQTLLAALNPEAFSDFGAADAASEVKLEELWKLLNPEAEETLSWVGFLKGVAAVRKNEEARELMGLTGRNQWAQISLLIDVEISEKHKMQLESHLSFFDRRGVAILRSKSKRKQMQNASSTDKQYSRLRKLSKGNLREIGEHSRQRILHHQRTVTGLAFLIGLIWNSIPAAFDTFNRYDLQSDGVEDLFFSCNDIGYLELPADGVVLEKCPMSNSSKATFE